MLYNQNCNLMICTYFICKGHFEEGIQKTQIDHNKFTSLWLLKDERFKLTEKAIYIYIFLNLSISNTAVKYQDFLKS